MNDIRIHLFGKFQVFIDGQVMDDLAAQKARELFCYLLLYRDRPHSREQLAEVLWGDIPTAQPTTFLRKAIWKLRHALDSQAERLSNHLLLVCSDWIQLNPEAELWLDVQVFEQTFNDAKAQTGGELEEACIQDLKMAVELFRGGLQENWYSDWYLLERERFQHEYLIILDRLIEYCEANQRYMEGVTYSNLILHYEKARERTHRQLMRLFALAKDRSAALNQYQRCVQILSEELGVNPSKRTVLLHQQIVDDQWPEPGSLWEKEAVPVQEAASLPGILERLKEIQSAIYHLQQQIDHEIQNVETIMHQR
jgi:DNA-binding SARP family transcriptional activator